MLQDNYNRFPKVYIIILNWNGWRDTIECLGSVYINSYNNYQVVVVDNNSTNDSINKIKAWANNINVDIIAENSTYFKNMKSSKPIPLIEYNYKEAVSGGNISKEIELCRNLINNIKYPLVIIQAGRNLGFSDGNNIGIKYALAKKDLDYVWVLNNDTVIDKDALFEMVKLAESNKKIGMVGSKLLFYYSPNMIQEIYGEVNWKDNGKGIGSGEKDIGQWDKNIEVKGRIMGASMLVKKNTICDIGLLDDKYFMEYEDTDWCMRTIQAGWKIFYCYKSKIWHKEGGTITGDSRIRRRFLFKSINLDTTSRFVILRYYGTRNSIYLVNKYYKEKLMLFLLTIVPQKLIRGFIKALLCKEKRSRCIKLIFKSIYDGIKCNMGKTIDPKTANSTSFKNQCTHVLFVHNTMAHYRKDFFKLFSQEISTKFIFTKMNISKKVYNVKPNMSDVGINSIILKNYFNIAVGLIPTLMKEDYDVVVAPTMDNIIECFESIVTIIIAKARRKKVIYFWEKWSISSQYMSLKRKVSMRLKDTIVKPFINYADVCIAPGKKSYEYFVKSGVNKSKIFIAPDSSIVEESNVYENIREKYKIPSNRKIILYYGRIIRSKGLEILIRCFKKIDSENGYLLICGDGEFKDYCKNLASKLDIKNIFFAGFVKPNKRSVYFSQCDVFVLPSYFHNGEKEAWGLTLNEAMQFGKPVIATTAVGAAFDLVQDGINGYVVEQNNEIQLYKALHKIISFNDNKLKNMGARSKEIIKNGYTYKDMVNGFNKAIDFIIAEERF